MHLFEQQALDSLLKEFEDVFLKELSQGLPPKCNIEHHIDRIPSIIPNTIPPYQLSRTEEDEVASQLKEYLRMGHICFVLPFHSIVAYVEYEFIMAVFTLSLWTVIV